MNAESATLLAAVVGAMVVIWQQRANWKETRRDKVRDAYAAWAGKLAVLRRKDEMVVEMTNLTWQNQNNRAHLGDKHAESLMRNNLLEITPQLHASRQEQHIAQGQEDEAFGLLILLDTNRARVARAQQVRVMPVFAPDAAGKIDNSKFQMLWQAQAEALGRLLLETNRTLKLERWFEFAWDHFERKQCDQEEAIRARLLVDRLGRPIQPAQAHGSGSATEPARDDGDF